MWLQQKGKQELQCMKEYIAILLENDISLLKILKDFKNGKIDSFMPKKSNQAL